MKFSPILTVSLATLAAAIIPDARILGNDGQDKIHSLPNLLKVDSVQELDSDWDIRDNIQLESGRLVVRDGPGSIWARKSIPKSQDEWTVELTFRNSEQIDVDDHSYYSTNGLSFWVLDGSIPTDTVNFGGARNFDGFQFLVNNLDYSGVKIFANDGTKEIVNSKDTSLGGCGTQYLDSMVPFTLRLSYSASKNWFKLQIDNKLCFATDALTFNNAKSDIVLGISASVDAKSKEYWEILKFDVFDGLTDDAKDDHGVADDTHKITITRTESSRPTNNVIRESLMSRMKGGASDSSVSDEVFAEITNKLESLEGMMGKFDTSSLASLVQDLQRSHEEIKDTLQEMKSAKVLLDSIIEKNQQEVMGSFRNLGRELSDEIKNVKAELKDTDARINTLFKERNDNDQFKFDNFSPNTEIFSVVVRWVLIPLVIGILILIVVVYRLKKDIKHAKLL